MSGFSNIFHDLKSSGSIVSPRGQRTLELTDYLARFKPYERFANFPSRKLSLPYIKQEFRWYLKGDPHDLSICEKAKLWQSMVTAEGTLNSNYGAYIFRGGMLDYVVDRLQADVDSRRALIGIMNNTHLNAANTDVPCTVSLGFRIRENVLQTTVHMRSADAIYGMGNDVPFFSLVQEMVLTLLNNDREEPLTLGPLSLFMESCHVYERHWPMLDRLLTESVEPVECPRLRDSDEIRGLRNSYGPSHYGSFVPPFTQWLHDAT